MGSLGEADGTSFPDDGVVSCDADVLVGRVADDIEVDGAFGGLRSHWRVVRQAPQRPLTFVATFVGPLA